MSPDALLFLTGVAAIVSLRIAIDVRHIAAAQHRRNRPAKGPAVSFIVELKQSAKTLAPLLEHLESVSDGQGEVIVRVWRTAGSRAHTELQHYRKRHKTLRLRIIRHTRGMSTERVIRQFARGTAVMYIDSHTRLSPGFVRTVATALSDLYISAVVPRRHIVLDHRILSAIRASLAQWRNIGHELFGAEVSFHLTPEIVYRKAHLLRQPKDPVAQYVSDAAVLIPAGRDHETLSLGMPPHNRAVDLFQIFAPLAVLAFAAAYLLIDIRGISTEYFIGLYVGGYATAHMGVKYYRFIDHLNLLLVSPFALTIAPIAAVVSKVMQAYHHITLHPWKQL